MRIRRPQPFGLLLYFVPVPRGAVPVVSADKGVTRESRTLDADAQGSVPSRVWGVVVQAELV